MAAGGAGWLPTGRTGPAKAEAACQGHPMRGRPCMAVGTVPEDWTLGFSQGAREKRPEAPVTSDSMEIDQKANSSKRGSLVSAICTLVGLGGHFCGRGRPGVAYGLTFNCNTHTLVEKCGIQENMK